MLFRSSNTWTSIAVYPGGPTMTGIAFSIGNKGYVGLGDDGGNPFPKKIFEYDTTTNIWTQKANFPGVGRTDALGLSMNGKGYIAIGDDGNGPFLKDLWEYNPIGDSWTQKTDFPGGPRCTAVGFAIASTGKLYIGTGDDNTNQYADFWEWNSATDTWTQVANFAGGIRTDETGFTIGNKGYVALGQIGAPPEFNDLWEYGTSTLTAISEKNAEHSIVISPNPFFSETNLITGVNLKNASLAVYNTLGKQVNLINNISGQKIIFNRANLVNGIYFIRITDEDQTVLINKLIISDN